ncbi:hypothetical protein [Qipengyuania sp. ASV99]|uniref:hypothetical protein n=1 Tax=Qipengyuania sp. ASV99 TaxID=3399681 RepID=UPI003A4C6239
MKATYLHAAGAIALTFGLAACVSAPTPAPVPPPVVRPAPTPTQMPPPVVQEPRYDNFLDAPQTPGVWEYEVSDSGPVAIFITANRGDQFIMACDRQRGQIELFRSGTAASPRAMIIRTETATRQMQVVQVEDTNPYLNADIAVNDPILDAMALTKGRFAVEVEGERTLYLPAWAEVSRVIEDCR